jgi:putative ABC transport system substrate-binding protein
VRRRAFITLLGGAAVTWPLAARAEPADRAQRVGVLAALAADDPEMQNRLAAFRQELERLGWLEGRNIRIDTRYAWPIALAQGLAKELVALQPNVILAHTTPVTAALQRESRTIPIVFAGVSDPVGAGFVASLARPGGNLTGLALYDASVAGKWIGMLKEIAPRLARVALVANPKVAYNYWLRAAEDVAPALAVEVIPHPVANAADIERAIESVAQAPNSGLLLAPDYSTLAHRDLIITLAARHRLPAVYPDRAWVVAGGLMSYGSQFVDQFREAASYVDHILRGAKPADLPAQVPTKYQTVVNLRTVKALGLTVPPGLLVAADEVIE